MMYNLGVEFSNSCCQVFWPSVPGQQGVHCLAQAGQEGVHISIPLSGDGQKMFVLSGAVFFLLLQMMEFLLQVMEQQEVPKTSPLHLLFLAKFYPEVCIT